MEKYELVENGFIILKEDSSLFSPIGTLYYEFYDDLTKVEEMIKEKSSEIQCRVGDNGLPFGKAQHPELWDYADNIDTIEFFASFVLLISTYVFVGTSLIIVSLLSGHKTFNLILDSSPGTPKTHSG